MNATIQNLFIRLHNEIVEAAHQQSAEEGDKARNADAQEVGVSQEHAQAVEPSTVAEMLHHALSVSAYDLPLVPQVSRNPKKVTSDEDIPVPPGVIHDFMLHDNVVSFRKPYSPDDDEPSFGPAMKKVPSEKPHIQSSVSVKILTGDAARQAVAEGLPDELPPRDVALSDDMSLAEAFVKVVGPKQEGFERFGNVVVRKKKTSDIPGRPVSMVRAM